VYSISSLNAKLNPICHLLELLGPHHILHVSRLRVNDNYNVLRLKKAVIRNERTSTVTICYIKLHRKRKGQSHLPSAGIIRTSPYSPR
jgi:hypothetical protein